MGESFVTPALLLWARQRSGLDLETLARKMKVKPEALRAWEDGSARPTFRQAQQLARRVNVPFGYLFLSKPPGHGLPIPDLRTIAGEQPREPSPEFSDLLNDVLNKQQWFREYRENEDTKPLPFIASYGLDDDVEDVAGSIRDTLVIDDEMRRRVPNWEGFLREFIRRTEQAGILVLRSGVVANNPRRPLDAAEFRGFAISDGLAPLVFINGRDYRVAQIFTLAHEMAHLWVGESGVSNLDYKLRSIEQPNDVERFCNRIAAETLVPAKDFKDRWKNGSASIETNLHELTARYQVSSVVILRQAYDLDIISPAIYWDYYDRLMGSAREPATASESGGNFYATLLTRNSSAFTTAVIASVAEGSLLYKEAASLLNVRVRTLGGIAEHVFGDRLSLA